MQSVIEGVYSRFAVKPAKKPRPVTHSGITVQWLADFKEEFPRMKKLTKTLSLVLVIAMVVSLCVVGASAKTFSDYKAPTTGTDYTEAIDVMSGVGIIEGMNGGI
jgi:hypothetical protein